jgi:hypothetical protein
MREKHDKDDPVTPSQDKETGFLHSIREFLFGFAAYEHVRYAHASKSKLGDTLTVVLFGDMLGVPMIRPYYAFRLLPYLLPAIGGWKQRFLKERDLVEALD